MKSDMYHRLARPIGGNAPSVTKAMDDQVEQVVSYFTLLGLPDSANPGGLTTHALIAA
jgi:hypothetical protein